MGLLDNAAKLVRRAETGPGRDFVKRHSGRTCHELLSLGPAVAVDPRGNGGTGLSVGTLQAAQRHPQCFCNGLRPGFGVRAAGLNQGFRTQAESA